MSIFDDYDPPETRRQQVILLLDVSGSMKENGKIDALNESVRKMIKVLQKADETNDCTYLTLIAFGGEAARLVFENAPIAQVIFENLRANGKTPIGQAFRLARELIEDRSRIPENSHNPTIALVSDGKPTDENWKTELDSFLNSEWGQRAYKFVLGIGNDADKDMLKSFSYPVYEAHEAAEIGQFLSYVTESITSFTMLESEISDLGPLVEEDENTDLIDDDK